MTSAEKRLPQTILEKLIKSGQEYGCKQDDFVDVINAARKVPMAVIGGQIQYVLPDATAELYWLSYGSEDRRPHENWLDYCNRAAEECINKFNHIISAIDIKKIALESFPILSDYADKGINIDDHQLFIIYFNDSGL